MGAVPAVLPLLRSLLALKSLKFFLERIIPIVVCIFQKLERGIQGLRGAPVAVVSEDISKTNLNPLKTLRPFRVLLSQRRPRACRRRERSAHVRAGRLSCRHNKFEF